MATIANRNEFIQQLARGRGMYHAGRRSSTGSNTTAAAAASGYITAHMWLGVQGVTHPTTLIGHQLPPTTEEILCAAHSVKFGTARPTILGWWYRFGTLNLAATGDRFTHDGTFTELRRTRYGEASKPIGLIPVVLISTATTVTAPVFRLRTAAAGTGYVDQDGNNVVGTKTMTMPAAATSINSCYIFRLEADDVSVRNIVAVEVTTAGTAGAAQVWGFEPLSSVTIIAVGGVGLEESLFGAFGPRDLQPAVPDAGSVTAHLGAIALGGSTSFNNSEADYFNGAVNAL